MRSINRRSNQLLGLVLLLHVTTAVQPSVAVDLIGYLPYYRMNASYNSNTLPAQLPMLDEIRYFGLTAASNGTITTLDGASVASHTSRIDTIKSIIAALPAEDRPRLDITLGGAGEASSFATIAASTSLRTTFAQNIKSLLDQTGATSVDIDWEHPTAGPERTTLYPAMLKRIKQEVGASRRVYATVDPTVMIPSSVFSGANAIDGLSLMTYDLGWWGNDPANPYGLEHSLPEYVEDAVEAWTEPPGSPNDRPWVFGTWGNNAPVGKLGVGLPFYGHTLDDDPNHPPATYTFSELAAGGATTNGNYYTYLGRSVWVPDPDLAAQRVEYAYDQGLQHMIIWEIGQDVHPDSMHPDPNKRSLLRAAYEAKRAVLTAVGDYDGDGDVDENDYNVWRDTFRSPSDSYADGNGDQVVDAADYVLWRKYASVGGVGSAIVSVPEPHAAYLLSFVSLWLMARRRHTTGCN